MSLEEQDRTSIVRLEEQLSGFVKNFERNQDIIISAQNEVSKKFDRQTKIAFDIKGDVEALKKTTELEWKQISDRMDRAETRIRDERKEVDTKIESDVQNLKSVWDERDTDLENRLVIVEGLAKANSDFANQAKGSIASLKMTFTVVSLLVTIINVLIAFYFKLKGGG